MDDVRTYQFLTPVFGGGVKVDGHKKPLDEVTPVRAASIRGQLRFWWRACNPRGLATVDELRRAEESIFGSTNLPSRLIVEVLKQPSKPEEKAVLEVVRAKPGPDGKERWTSRPVRGMEEIAYGAFPLRDTRDGIAEQNREHGRLHLYSPSDTFSVRFRYAPSSTGEPGDADVGRDVEAALWAWSNFGGLGGRTRRGFGAIAQVDGAPLPSIEDGWSMYVNGADVAWPHLPVAIDRGCTIGARRYNSGREAHECLLGLLQKLRQGVYGRKRGPEDSERGEGGHPGRSYWPEADAIRELTGCAHRAKGHDMRVTRGVFFPRAAFGMPIIFHFKDAPRDSDARGRSRQDPKGFDPIDYTLVPDLKNRWASPLLLRPHKERDGRIVPLAVVLEPRRPPASLVLQGQSTSFSNLRGDLSEEEARRIPLGNRPSPLMKENRPVTDPIERFCAELGAPMEDR